MLWEPIDTPNVTAHSCTEEPEEAPPPPKRHCPPGKGTDVADMEIEHANSWSGVEKCHCCVSWAHRERKTVRPRCSRGQAHATEKTRKTDTQRRSVPADRKPSDQSSEAWDKPPTWP